MTNVNIAEIITYKIRYILLTCNIAIIRFMHVM